MDKIKNKLLGWKAKHLNLAGRATLVQTTITSTSIYSMQANWLLSRICENNDRHTKQFMWFPNKDT